MSEERVSALEQQLRRLSQQSAFACLNGRDIAYTLAADMVHERDAQLWALLEEIEEDRKSEDHFAEYPQYMDAATPLRAILEGQTETP